MAFAYINVMDNEGNVSEVKVVSNGMVELSDFTDFTADELAELDGLGINEKVSFAALKELPGVVASDPKGAFYIMVQLPVDDAEKFAIWTLENFAIDNETVMFAPGNGFYSDPELGVNEARLAYVLNCDDLKKAIYILGEALKAYPGKTN